jgi:hypothetical protein
MEAVADLPPVDARLAQAATSAPGPLIRFLTSWSWRIGTVALGVLLPLGCIGLTIAMQQPAAQDFRSLSQFVFALCMPKGMWPLYPLVAFAMACIARFAWEPESASQLPIVRLGLQSGAALALYYSSILLAALLDPTSGRSDAQSRWLALMVLAAVLAPLVITAAFWQAERRWPDAAKAIIACGSVFGAPFTLQLVLILLAFAAPAAVCSFAGSALAANRIAREQGSPPPSRAAWMTCIGAHIAAWSASLVVATHVMRYRPPVFQ